MIRRLLDWLCSKCEYDQGFEDGYQQAKLDFEGKP